ncbi:MAG: Gfo/Idh/MocA family oxidoreductase [Lentisphaeria bacterium]|nr:Gfo/Idh/MocA family oxidoreductase [Lentisphaeria bacterium]
MSETIKAAIIGLDTSHATEFPKFIHDPAMDPEFRVHGMTVTRALRFETPFQKKEGLDKRQAYLESIGVKVTEDFEEAVADCDAVFIEINDPSYHLDYFRKCAALGKPVFLDKPFADSLDNAIEILKIAKENHIRFFTASSLRFDANIVKAHEEMPEIELGQTWGPLGKAAAGSSIIWYGVHTFEMLEKIMGPGAIAVTSVPDRCGVVCTVAYADGRRGVVELTRNNSNYGGVLRKGGENRMFTFVGGKHLYHNLVADIGKFFRGESEGVPLKESFEIMAMLEAAELSVQYGRTMPVYQFPNL